MDPISWDRRARSVDGLGRGLIVQERRQEGQGGAGATNKDQLRDICWQCVYTSGRWGKSLNYSVPLLYPGQRYLFKIVLFVEVPRDLSDHGVGVAHKAAAVLQKKIKK